MVDNLNNLLKPVEWPKGRFIPAVGGMDGYSAAYSSAARALAVLTICLFYFYTATP
jgi:hypothetical protein